MDRLTHIRGSRTFPFGKPVFARTEPGVEEATVSAGAEAAELTGAAAPSAEETTAPAASGGTSGSQEDQGFEAPFRLEDIEDETVRSHVERYTKQVQGAYTRKTQELAQQRKSLAPYQTLQERLESDDEATRDAAVREVLQKAGWKDTSEPGETEHDDEHAATTSPDPQAEARIAALEQAEQDRQQNAYLDAFKAQVEGGLSSYFKELGLDKIENQQDREAAQARERQAVVAVLGTLQPLEGDMPDIDGAITLRKADVAAIQTAAQKAYRASKDVPDTPAGGASGTSATDLSDGDKRRAKQLEIVGRHL